MMKQVFYSINDNELIESVLAYNEILIKMYKHKDTSQELQNLKDSTLLKIESKLAHSKKLGYFNVDEASEFTTLRKKYKGEVKYLGKNIIQKNDVENAILELADKTEQIIKKYELYLKDAIKLNGALLIWNS